MSLNKKQINSDSVSKTLQYDLCPWANSYISWLQTPLSGLFVACAASVLLGIYVAPQGFAVAAIVVGFILMGILWPAIAMRGIAGELHWQQRKCIEGESTEAILEVSNRWPWPVWGLTIDLGIPTDHDDNTTCETVSLACVKAMTKTKFVWSVTPPRRGEYPQQPATLATGFPFGIWNASKLLAIPKSLLVWPRSVELHDMPSLAGDDRSIAGAWIDRAGYEGDVIGARAYRDGDSLRFVHWAQSAARDSLVVCERQSVAKQVIRLRLACTQAKTNCERDRETQEWLIRVTASLARTFLSHHWSLNCVLNQQALFAEPTQHGIDRVMDALAVYESRDVNVGERSWRFLECASRRETTTGRNRELEVVVASRAAWQESMESSTGRTAALWLIVDSDREDFGTEGLDGSVWMQLDMVGNVWSQLKQEWERLCHDSYATPVG